MADAFGDAIPGPEGQLARRTALVLAASLDTRQRDHVLALDRTDT
jgi:hypothetical protein